MFGQDEPPGIIEFGAQEAEQLGGAFIGIERFAAFQRNAFLVQDLVAKAVGARQPEPDHAGQLVVQIKAQDLCIRGGLDGGAKVGGQDKAALVAARRKAVAKVI